MPNLARNNENIDVSKALGKNKNVVKSNMHLQPLNFNPNNQLGRESIDFKGNGMQHPIFNAPAIIKGSHGG